MNVSTNEVRKKNKENKKEREKKSKYFFVSGGSQSVASYEDLSSSSFSSASRASLDARSSPTPSYGAENMMVFPGDSSGSI